MLRETRTPLKPSSGQSPSTENYDLKKKHIDIHTLVKKKKKLKLSVEQEQQHKEDLDDITTTPSALLKRQNRKHIFPKHTGAYWKMSTTAHFCSPGENRFRTSIS